MNNLLTNPQSQEKWKWILALIGIIVFLYALGAFLESSIPYDKRTVSQKLYCLLKLPFLASLSLNFSTICLHMLSKSILVPLQT